MHSEGYGTWFVSVFVCVCLSVRSSVSYHARFLRPRATRQRNGDTGTNWFIATLASFFSVNYCVQKLWREKSK